MESMEALYSMALKTGFADGGLQIVYTIEVLMVRKPKFGFSKGVLPSLAGKLCFADSGTAHCPCLHFRKIQAFVPLTN